MDAVTTIVSFILGIVSKILGGPVSHLIKKIFERPGKALIVKKDFWPFFRAAGRNFFRYVTKKDNKE